MYLTKGAARLRRHIQSLRMSDQPITHCPLRRQTWANCKCR